MRHARGSLTVILEDVDVKLVVSYCASRGVEESNVVVMESFFASFFGRRGSKSKAVPKGD
jgi:hypothetical protein